MVLLVLLDADLIAGLLIPQFFQLGLTDFVKLLLVGFDLYFQLVSLVLKLAALSAGQLGIVELGFELDQFNAGGLGDLAQIHSVVLFELGSVEILDKRILVIGFVIYQFLSRFAV